VPGDRHYYVLVQVAFTAIVLLVTLPGGNLALAVYALSFWHYYLYWLAFRYRAIPLAEFRRHAVLAKTVALLAFASVYLAAPLHWLSLTVVAGGFLLNILAVRVLGSDRTYFGHELAGLPHRKIIAFPYSWTSHPMLFGNMAAFGGALLNADFRQYWWPLAAAHVALNFGVLIMEITLRPRRTGKCAPSIGALLTAIGAAVGGVGAGPTGAILGALLTIYAFVIWLRYSALADHKIKNL